MSIALSYNNVDIQYFFSPKHRGNATYDISVWGINYNLEFECFSTCFMQGWHNGSTGWGFINIGVKQLLKLGYNSFSQDLTIAKFISDHDQWHGYPADIRHKPKDKPLPDILQDWLLKGHISKALMARIKQGQI